MWIGHVFPAFLVRPFLPRLPLSLLFFGCASADFLAFLLSLVGVEVFRYNPIKHGTLPYDFLMPYTHSLLGMSAWAVLYAAVCAALVSSGTLSTPDARAAPGRKSSAMSIFTPIALLVISHWVLEIPVHRTLKDGVPLIPGGDIKFGWGGFNFQLWSNVLELGLFLPAFAFYVMKTSPAGVSKKQTASGVDTLVPWYARPVTFGMFCVVSQLMVCAAPQWFYALTPDTVMLCNGLLLMAAETAMAHAMDMRRTVNGSAGKTH